MGKFTQLPLEVFINDLPKEMTVSVANEDEGQVLKFRLKTLVATVGCGDTTVRSNRTFWATVYRIDDHAEGVSSVDYRAARPLLKALRDYYAKHGYDFGYSFAETALLREVLYKLQIKQREQGTLNT